METADEFNKTTCCVRSQLGDLTLILTGRKLAVRHKDGRLVNRYNAEEVLDLVALLKELRRCNPKSGEYFYTRKSGIRISSHHTSTAGMDSFMIGFDDRGVHVEAYLPYMEIVRISECLLAEYGKDRYYGILRSYQGFDVLGRIKKINQAVTIKNQQPTKEQA